ncbi:hypothetical protein V9K67_21150 [Paraflavisolibacter sp. H34]|uniref:hypothetical protein n=1 Tax=Huijunlia imazamoxiresistens TaxID=3127457 RepID=UPI0030163906
MLLLPRKFTWNRRNQNYLQLPQAGQAACVFLSGSTHPAFGGAGVIEKNYGAIKLTDPDYLAVVSNLQYRYISIR